VKGLPILGKVTYQLLSDIATSYGAGKKGRMMEELCARIIEEFRREGLSDSSSDFLLDHGPSIQSRIQDEELSKVDVRME
jgi:hypothetical protein